MPLKTSLYVEYLIPLHPRTFPIQPLIINIEIVANDEQEKKAISGFLLSH
jgi:hypothetical protein